MNDNFFRYIAEEALRSPMDWDEGGRVHNWRNYVGERMQALWETFTDDQKKAIAVDAYEISSREHWD